MSECQLHIQNAQEGALYASKEIYNQNFSHRDEYWFRNRLEQGYSDGQKTPTDGLVGETVLGHLETLAQNPSFDSSVKSNKDLQKEVYSAINESMLMVRNEDPNAFQIGDMSYPNLKRLGMLGYFPEPGLEGVYPELLLIPTPVKGVNTLLLNGEKLALQGASKVIPKLGVFAEKYPLLAELGVSATANTAYQGYKMAKYGENYDPYSLVETLSSTALTRNMGFGNQLRTNLLIGTASYEMQGKDNELPSKWGDVLIGTSSGAIVNKALGYMPFGNVPKQIIGAGVGEVLGDSNYLFKENRGENEPKK